MSSGYRMNPARPSSSEEVVADLPRAHAARPGDGADAGVAVRLVVERVVPAGRRCPTTVGEAVDARRSVDAGELSAMMRARQSGSRRAIARSPIGRSADLGRTTARYGTGSSGTGCRSAPRSSGRRPAGGSARRRGWPPATCVERAVPRSGSCWRSHDQEGDRAGGALAVARASTRARSPSRRRRRRPRPRRRRPAPPAARPCPSRVMTSRSTPSSSAAAKVPGTGLAAQVPVARRAAGGEAERAGLRARRARIAGHRRRGRRRWPRRGPRSPIT